MIAINIIHNDGGCTTLRNLSPEAYGTVYAELTDDPSYTYEGTDRSGATFREVIG